MQVIVVVAAVVLGLGLWGWDRMRLGVWIRVRALILGCGVKLCTSSTRWGLAHQRILSSSVFS